MEDQEIKNSINLAILKLIERDCWLLQNNMSEQSISHKLAIYIEEIFTDFDVDCEYNGNVDHSSGKKKIQIFKDDLINKGLLRRIEEGGEDFAERSVFPDIIVHKRGSNKKNTCIIEVKKSTSKIPIDYDQLKLRAYTTDYNGNDLNYQLGIFIYLTTGIEFPSYTLLYYKNGVQI